MYIEKTITYHQLTQKEFVEKVQEANDNGNCIKDIKIETVIKFPYDSKKQGDEYLYLLVVEIRDKRVNSNEQYDTNSKKAAENENN